METAIIYENTDGTIRYTVPARNSRLFRENQAEWLDLVEKHERSIDPSLNGAVRLPDLAVSDLPDGRFRNCWRNEGGHPQVELALARTQRLEEIRAERNSRLQASDGLMARARELGIQSEIEAFERMRQALRDLPPTFDLEDFTAPAELAEFEPTWPTHPGG